MLKTGSGMMGSESSDESSYSVPLRSIHAAVGAHANTRTLQTGLGRKELHALGMRRSTGPGLPAAAGGSLRGPRDVT